MKKIKNFLLFTIVSIICCLIFIKGNVNAADADFYKNFSDEPGDDSYDFKLKYKCKLTIRMENLNDDEYFDDIEGLYVSLDKYDDSLEYYSYTVFDKDLCEKSPYTKTITLSPGKYRLYIFSDNKYSVTLSGKYVPTLSSKNVTLEEGKTKTLKINGATDTVTWKSSNKSIASINSNGVIKAKKAGTTTITVKCGNYTFKCKVTVTKKPPTYKELAKKMKAFAKKNKNFKFKTIDVGNKCRLYAQDIDSIYTSKIDTEGFYMIASYQPYIELVRKGNTAVMRLRFGGYLKEVSISSTNLYCSSLKLSTSNRKLNFDLNHISGKNTYNYSTYIYTGEMRGYATISTSSKVNSAKLNKFNKMLGQKSFVMRIVSSNGAYYYTGFSKSTRNNWKNLVKEYKTLLKAY